MSKEGMEKGRLEAFTDGVMAIVLTILVLEMKIPHGGAFTNLVGLWPVFVSYVLSFAYVGMYWNNHHHLLQAARSVDNWTLWANLNLLFWLSLLPFSTGWMGENHFATVPTMLYGLNLLLVGIAYLLLQTAVVRHHGVSAQFRRLLGRDWKSGLSLLCYVLGIALSWYGSRSGLCLFWLVPMLWAVPDGRMARLMASQVALVRTDASIQRP